MSNQSFKYSFLERRKSSSLTAMLSICIDEFLPHNYDNYVDENRRAHSSYRKYSNNIPVYLVNRPRPLVKHCMKMIDKLQGISLDGINTVTNRLYNVASFQSTSRAVYQCYLGDAKHLPTCSCPSWFDSIHPCKHFFAVFCKKNLSRSDFDPSYGNSPYFILDPLLDENNYSTSSHVQESAELKNLKNTPASVMLLPSNIASAPYEHSHSTVCSHCMNVNSNPTQNADHDKMQSSHHSPAACRELLTEIIKLTHLGQSQLATDNLFDGLYKLKIAYAESITKEQGIILRPDPKSNTWKKSALKFPNLVNVPVRHKRKMTKRVGVKYDTMKAASNISVKSEVKNNFCESEIVSNQVIDDSCEMFVVPAESLKIQQVTYTDCHELHEVPTDNDCVQLQTTVHSIKEFKSSLIGYSERNEIENGLMLNDNIINYFQQMMSVQLNIDVGLQDPIKGKVLSFNVVHIEVIRIATKYKFNTRQFPGRLLSWLALIF
nr:uncharacterized protein LOC124819376 [Hydra vulgaris]